MISDPIWILSVATIVPSGTGWVASVALTKSIVVVAAPIPKRRSARGVSCPVSKLICSTIAVSPAKLVTVSPNVNKPRLVTLVTVLRFEANPVTLPVISSPVINVPSEM